MHARVFAYTHRSRSHDRNQDRAVVGSTVLEATDDVQQVNLVGPAVLAVLDGLGGHPAGDVASELAAGVVTDATVPTDESAAAKLLVTADECLQDAMRTEPTHQGMGSTATLLIVPGDGEPALVASVGDTSVWRLEGEHLRSLSTLDRGPGGTVLQCLGANDNPVQPHVGSVPLHIGDRVLLASDGLTDVVPPDTLSAALRVEPERAVDHLRQLVHQAGFPDDVTILLAEIVRPD